MGYDPRLPFMFQYQQAQRDPRTLAQVQATALANQTADQNMVINREQQNNANVAAGQTAEYNRRTLDPRVTQAINTATQGGLENDAMRAKVPVNNLSGQQAGIESGILGQMFPGFGQAQPPSTTMPPPMQNQFAGKTLAELRQMKMDAGPASDFVGKMIDPMIKGRSETEEVAPALKEISAAASLPGGTREEARAKAAALSGVIAKYPLIAGDPRLKEAITAAMPKNPDVVFNPIGQNAVDARLIGTYLTDWRGIKNNYEKVAQPYLAIQGIKKSSAWGTGVGDQSLIDKLILLETGKVPTEAQYFQFAHNLGFEDKIDKLTGKLVKGAILGENARQQMLNEAKEQMNLAHEGYDHSANEQTEIMQAAGANPATVVHKGGYYNEVGKALTEAEAPKGGKAVAPLKNWKDGDRRVNTAGTPMIRENGKWRPE